MCSTSLVFYICFMVFYTTWSFLFLLDFSLILSNIELHKNLQIDEFTWEKSLERNLGEIIKMKSSEWFILCILLCQPIHASC